MGDMGIWPGAGADDITWPLSSADWELASASPGKIRVAGPGGDNEGAKGGLPTASADSPESVRLPRYGMPLGAPTSTEEGGLEASAVGNSGECGASGGGDLLLAMNSLISILGATLDSGLESMEGKDERVPASKTFLMRSTAAPPAKRSTVPREAAEDGRVDRAISSEAPRQ